MTPTTNKTNACQCGRHHVTSVGYVCCDAESWLAAKMARLPIARIAKFAGRMACCVAVSLAAGWIGDSYPLTAGVLCVMAGVVGFVAFADA